MANQTLIKNRELISSTKNELLTVKNPLPDTNFILPKIGIINRNKLPKIISDHINRDDRSAFICQIGP